MNNVTRISSLHEIQPPQTSDPINNHEFITTTSFREISIPDRVASLVKQTADIMIQSTKQVADKFIAVVVTKQEAIKYKYLATRQKVCQNLWTVMVALHREQKKLEDAHSGFCFDADLVPLPTLQERIFCGRLPDIPVCEDELSDDYDFNMLERLALGRTLPPQK
jgi:hypothetical protein